MILRCILDGLILPAVVRPGAWPPLVAFDGDEAFPVEAVEAAYYEVVTASPAELLVLERARYRLLRPAVDFRHLAG